MTIEDTHDPSTEAPDNIHPLRSSSYSIGTRINPRRIDKDTYKLNFIDSTGERVDCVTLSFQAGPVLDYGVNGITSEAILDVLIARTKELNQLFPCPENVNAIAGLESAAAWFARRTTNREIQGVEGKDEAHNGTIDDDVVIEPFIG